MSVDVHHTESGPAKAPPLVLAGSLGSTLRMWDPQVEALSADFRVIRYDHRGHGGTPAPTGPYSMADLGADVLRLLDRLGIRRAHFAGLSLGGMVGQWLGVHAPERIDRLALLATSPHIGPPSTWRDRIAIVRERGAGALADAVVERWFTPAYAKEHSEEVARIRDEIAATDPEGYAGCCAAIEHHDVRGVLDRIQAPTLVLAGADDAGTPPRGHGELIAERVPDARLVVLDDAAHLLSWQRAAKVNTLLAEHFASPSG
ncbi:3-oxoadipate enol-lactonase [Nocardiopsis sp. CNR-923]|uniref:3-oxoadipate enol-lactonase n=1 Tax=Nocardiopsis sp. CNR-923 TaxID=1904965 RepID=UPI00096A00E6|nr:3-oxoadipate enol-lactonase [Nocardiopsis sp. CNR-923]OLT30625.1 3-oxoadipate enol-lactonase [Nocardiopsis sp. CNR-923]